MNVLCITNLGSTFCGTALALLVAILGVISYILLNISVLSALLWFRMK